MPKENPIPNLDLLPLYLTSQNLHVVPVKSPLRSLCSRTVNLSTVHSEGHFLRVQKGHFRWAAKLLPFASINKSVPFSLLLIFLNDLCNLIPMPPSNRLRHSLKILFGEYEFRHLRWKEDQELIISRILSSGNWGEVCWLRSKLKDEGLKTWIIAHRGNGLSVPKLRFWELILNLSHRQVNLWLKNKGFSEWEHRVPR